VEPNLDVILARRLLREQGGAVHAVEVHKGCGRCDNCLKGMYTACLNYGKLNKGHRSWGFTTGPWKKSLLATASVVLWQLFSDDFILWVQSRLLSRSSGT
jgi:threonine dehydrogenase-like Zn-dependent dehydrogenase